MKRFLKPFSSSLSKSAFFIRHEVINQKTSYDTFRQTSFSHLLTDYQTGRQQRLQAVFHPTAVVMLNRMTVIYKINGGEQTLHELNQSPYLKEWEKHYLYHSLLGEIYAETDKTKARKSFEKAMTLTKSNAEQKLLQHKIDQMR